jgi:cell fate (sporulation/competence/biofilm development) regulator YlbF (YheA/YmcA/DUF963 family)
MSDPLEMARDLGRSIAASAQYQDLMNSEKSFAGDTEAVGLLKSFEGERKKLQNLKALGMELPPSALQELETIQEKIRDNGAIKNLMNNQKNYEDLLRKVNEEINRQIEEVTKASLPTKIESA